MKEISIKLHKQGLEKMKPFINQLTAEGMEKDKIVGACKKYTDSKINSYYTKLKEPQRIRAGLSHLIDELQDKAEDSKAELVFYDLLINAQIPFIFQYSIGPYTTDYLVYDTLVVELDGPQHNKTKDKIRDKYLRGLGYKILRVPLMILAIDPEAVIKEIQAIKE